MIPHSRPSLGEKEIQAASKVLRSGMLAQGEEAQKFEKKMCKFIGVTHGAAVSSGSAALLLLLKALNIGPGDEVALPAFVCTSPLNCIYQTGARPLLVDIEPDSFNISTHDLKQKINKKTKAIIVPHMFGHPAELDTIIDTGLPLIEDCAMSLGATYKGKTVGSFGIASIFSFYATKVITTGEGGMIISNSEDLIEKIKDLRSYDEKEDYKMRFNFKITDLQAAIGLVQLARLPKFIDKRRKIASMYNKEFNSLTIKLPLEKDSYIKSNYYRYVIRVSSNVEMALRLLQQKGVIARRPVFKSLNQYMKLRGFSHTNAAYKEAISLPIYPSLNKQEIATIIEIVKDIFA